MNVEQIMKLVDNYVSACVDLESENNNYGTVDGSSVRYTDDARNEVLVALEQLTKDAEKVYQAGHNAGVAHHKKATEHKAKDAAITAQKGEQI